LPVFQSACVRDAAGVVGNKDVNENPVSPADFGRKIMSVERVQHVGRAIAALGVIIGLTIRRDFLELRGQRVFVGKSVSENKRAAEEKNETGGGVFGRRGRREPTVEFVHTVKYVEYCSSRKVFFPHAVKNLPWNVLVALSVRGPLATIRDHVFHLQGSDLVGDDHEGDHDPDRGSEKHRQEFLQPGSRLEEKNVQEPVDEAVNRRVLQGVHPAGASIGADVKRCVGQNKGRRQPAQQHTSLVELNGVSGLLDGLVRRILSMRQPPAAPRNSARGAGRRSIAGIARVGFSP